VVSCIFYWCTLILMFRGQPLSELQLYFLYEWLPLNIVYTYLAWI